MNISKSENALHNLLGEIGIDEFKNRLYSLSEQYETSVILDSCNLNSGCYPGKYEFMAAYGCENEYCINDPSDLNALKGKWAFGILSYDIKNHIEKLSSTNAEFIPEQSSVFVEPELLITIDRNGILTVVKGQVDVNDLSIRSTEFSNDGLKKVNKIFKDDYIPKIERIKELILDGEVYELNFCVQHQYTFERFDPLAFHLKLIKRSPVPMASYLKHKGKYLCGASMERYLMKDINMLKSQPIKGTIRKSQDPVEDAALKTTLYHSVKERAENVMIVDLVRNDLAKVCKSGSVKVDELFGIYSYLQLHQMISSVSGTLVADISHEQIIRASFPMGSMTGAPKVSAMKHIDELENFKRGWYSGALGYFDPEGNFDLNVVIRSLICFADQKKLAYSAGGAITIDSVPESEWLECLLKTKAIEDILIN